MDFHIEDLSWVTRKSLPKLMVPFHHMLKKISFHASIFAFSSCPSNFSTWECVEQVNLGDLDCSMGGEPDFSLGIALASTGTTMMVGGWVGGYVNALTRILPSYKPKQCFLRVLKIHTSTLLCQSSPSFNFPPFQFPFLFSSSSFHLSLVLLKGSETPRKECFAA